MTEGLLRVSVATLDRVIFPRPRDGMLMLALERKGTAGAQGARVRAQPFGGAVRILDSEALRAAAGEFDFDSERSRQEGDFRILIQPRAWAAVREFCFRCLEKMDAAVLESDPARELVEEFDETAGILLRPGQYHYQPAGFVVEDIPTPTDNLYSLGQPTVRLYRIFEVRLIDVGLCGDILAVAERFTDADLAAQARNDARGRANGILALPLETVTRDILAIPPDLRYSQAVSGGHAFDASVLALLPAVDVQQYERLAQPAPKY